MGRAWSAGGEYKMSRIRELGFTICERVSHDPKVEQPLRDSLGITQQEMKKLYDGRLFLTGADLRKISEVCGSELLQNMDQSAYNERVVHCMTAFKNPADREKILDLIDAYIDAREALESC